MNDTSANDTWIAFLSRVDAGEVDGREAVRLTREHYDAVYGSNFAAVIRMLEDIDKRLEETRGKAIAAAANSVLVREFMERLDSRLDALAAHDRMTDARLETIEQRLDAKRERIGALDARIGVLETRATALEERLDARPSPEQAQATYTGVQRILSHLGLDEDGNR